MVTKTAKKPAKVVTEAEHGGVRKRAGRPADPDPSYQVNGRIKGWANEWLLAEVESGRARSVTALVGELIVEAAKARGAKEPG